MAERDVRREAEELREAEERRHVDLPHRTGAEKHPQAYREDEPGGTAADGREPGPGTEEDVPVQDRGPVPADRPTAEGVDRTDARPDR